VHCPDRLARTYAHQVLLLEEFLRAGVEVIFLNREVGQTPEDQLLLQVQGMIAEYERAKILERSRRGKRHAAQVGRVSVLSCAPYGYRYVGKQDGAGEARFEVVLEEARVVRQIFTWVGRDRWSIGEVQRRLQAAGERTRTGKTSLRSRHALGHPQKPRLQRRSGLWQNGHRTIAPPLACATRREPAAEESLLGAGQTHGRVAQHPRPGPGACRAV
jgi:hypothetical protein